MIWISMCWSGAGFLRHACVAWMGTHTACMFGKAADEIERLRKIEAAAQAVSNFNGGLFEFNVALRRLKAAVETETDE